MITKAKISKEGNNDFQFPVDENGNRVATGLTETEREKMAKATRKKFGVKEKFVK